MLNVLRWLAVLPGALAGAFISSFPVHVVLFQTLTGSGLVEPYPDFPERLFVPFAATLALVYLGAKIAPSHKVETAAILFGVLLFLLGAAFALGLSGARIGSFQVHLQLAGFAAAGAIFGALIGLYLVHRKSQKSLNLKS